MYISNLKRSVDSMHAGQKLEHSVGLEVIFGVFGVVIEGEARLTSRTGGICGLSGSDIVLSGFTVGEYCHCDH